MRKELAVGPAAGRVPGTGGVQCRERTLASAQGLTALETLIMLVLFGSVMVAIYSAVVTGLRAMTVNRAWLHAEYGARRAVDRMLEEVRWGYEVAGVDPAVLRVRVPSGMPLVPDREYVVEFFRQGGRLVRRVEDQEELLAPGVVDFRVRYFDHCGVEVTDPDAAAEVRRVTVEVATRHENYEGRAAVRRLRADAALRNYPWRHPVPDPPPSPAPTPCF
ncbi:MAG: hypothetical protein QN144_13870 [Armatimonadota bacterium]|nr:hypothetical protein [Armatimonadota bacterium]MDR7408251.1 hypothetical protein [Armatimonadota bacterium]